MVILQIAQKNGIILLDKGKCQFCGADTTTDVLLNSTNEIECREMIIKWGENVYKSWKMHHETVDLIAKGFIDKNKDQLSTHGY